MTGSEPDVLTGVVEGVVPTEDTAGCRFVVASYESAAPVVSAVRDDAARRIIMAPALGDFIDLRFVDLGPRPEPSESRSLAVQLITEELLAPGGQSGHNYFAVAVADRSAAEVAQLLTECADDPFLARLPLRLHGTASVDDRSSADEGAAGASIAVAHSGAWSHADLVDELRRYANDLLNHFAAGQQSLSPAELDSLRYDYEQQFTPEGGNESAETPELPAPPAPAAQPDILATVPPPSVPAEPVPAEPAALEPSPPPADAPTPAAASPLVRLPRWLLEPRRRRGKRPESGEAAETQAPKIAGLAYLLNIGDEIPDDDGVWQRSRAALLSVDAKIATLPQAAYQVRVLYGDAEALHGGLRPAGQLSRREVRHQVADIDFAGVLEGIRAMLRRDLAHVTPPVEPPTYPVVVFFAPDPPLSDSVTADAFSHLANEATIIWVVPKTSIELLASDFIEPHAYVLPDDDYVADEIADLLTPAANAPPSAL